MVNVSELLIVDNIIPLLKEFSLVYTVTSARASVAISYRILFCVVALSEKKEVPFSMAIGNEQLMHKCFLKHSRMGTAKMK